MTEELIHDIEMMNRLERKLELMWLRGENIPEELLTQIDEARSKVKQAITESPNQ